MDYFQMSETLCDDCCKNFDKAIMAIYMKEYLRVPTKADLKAIAQLHKSVHQVDGMFGSLDCTHTYWKNCPKAWHGTYKGKEKKPSIVLEAICDYQLFFWHASYGYCGTLNDINILNLSPFLSQLVDGTFHEQETEKEAAVVPYSVGDESFDRMFVLVDGTYPQFSRFVKGIKLPLTEEQKKYTAWQEATRKEIERAFGVLKAT